MEVTKYRAFLAAAELESFTSAADSLGYTQSGITRMIRSLEEELGFPLFVRRKSGVALTEEGKTLLPKIREAVRAEQVIEETSAEILGSVQGTITVGCYYSISAMWMPDFLKEFLRKYPGVKVNIREGGNLELAVWLRERSADLCLGARPEAETEFDWIPLYRDRMMVWLPSGHPAAEQETFPLMDLEKYPFIHTSPDHDTDQDRLIAEEGLKMDERFSTRDGFATFNMVEAGLGISFNQELIARRWTGEVVRLPLSPARYVELGAAVPSLREMSPAAGRFLSCVQEIMKSTPAFTSSEKE